MEPTIVDFVVSVEISLLGVDVGAEGVIIVVVVVDIVFVVVIVADAAALLAAIL